MLVPPSSSDLLGCTFHPSFYIALTDWGETAIDPTRLNKARKFAPSTTPNARNPDTSLWTETPAERQQRLADELSGKRKRKENSEGAAGDDDGKAELEARKRVKRDEEIQRAVSEHTVRSLFIQLLNTTLTLCRGKIGLTRYLLCTQRLRLLRKPLLRNRRKKRKGCGTILAIWPSAAG